MSIEDYRILISRLKEEQEDTNNLISKYQDKISIFNLKNNKYSSLCNVLLFTLNFMILLIGTIIIGPLSIFLELPNYIFPVITFLVPLISTVIENSIIKNVKKVNKKFKSISNSKKESDILEEEINTEIEYEQLLNKKMLNDYLLSKAESRSKYADKKITVNKSENALNFSIKEMQEDINKSIKNINILIKKKVLSQKFSFYRNKNYSIIIKALYPIIIGLFMMVFINIPILLFNNVLAFGSEIYSFSILVPTLIGYLGGYVYFNEKDKTLSKVFNKFNGELNHKSLTDKVENESREKREFNRKIKSKTQKLSLDLLDIEEEKSKLRFLKNNQNTNEENNLNVENISIRKEDNMLDLGKIRIRR